MVRLRLLGYLFLASLICVLLWSAPIRADGVKDLFKSIEKSIAKEKFIARVRLFVESSPYDQTLRGKVTSCISRELRSIGDVEIVDKEADWILMVVRYPIRAGKKHLGDGLAVTVLKEFDKSAMENYMRQLSGEEEYKEGIRDITSNLTKFRDLIVLAGSKESLKSRCEKLVAVFDSKYLEHDRNTLRKLQGIFKELAEEKPIQK